jgi:hypothetical protein
MNRLKYILLASALLAGTNAFAQQGYREEHINFKGEHPDSPNSRLLKQKTTNLGTLLVQGYVDGKLTGYKFPYNVEHLKNAPPPKESWPPKWNSKNYYFLGDRVTYKGNIYDMVNEIGPSPVPPDKSDKWMRWRFKLEGQPLRVKYSYPSIKDTLPKGEFLKSMISFEEPISYVWFSSSEYFEGNKVVFQGKIYQAIQDVEPGTSLSDENYWRRQSRSLPFFFNSLDNLTSITVLNYFTVEEDTTWIPQTLSLRVFDDNRGYALRLISFLYCDVIGYLKSISQPLLYLSDLGYIGHSTFILDEKSREKLLHFIQIKLKMKELAEEGLIVMDHSKLADFANGAEGGKEKFGITQDLNTNDLRIKSHGQTIAIIPIGKFLDIAQLEEPAVFIYADAINQRIFKGYKETPFNDYSYFDIPVVIDSLIPFPICQPLQVKKSAGYYWLEEDSVAFQNSFKRDIILDAWSCIVAAAQEKSILPEKERNVNSLSYDWSKTYKDTLGLDLTDENWLTLLHGDNYNYESPIEYAASDNSIKFTGFSVIYKRYFPTDNIKFTPLGIKVYGEWKETNISDSFKWESVREVWRKRDPRKYNRLIDSIERGELPIGNSKLVAGLQEID